jgi:co-chaperonin GroES (HSP10)
MTATLTPPEVNAFTLEVLGDRYLIGVQEENSEYTVKMPDGTEKKIEMVVKDGEKAVGYMRGIIVRVGNGHRLETDVTVPMFYERGDMVICERMAGAKMNFGGRTYRMVNQTNVLARVPK